MFHYVCNGAGRVGGGVLWNYLKTSRATTENYFLACFPTIVLSYCQITLMHVDFPDVFLFAPCPPIFYSRRITSTDRRKKIAELWSCIVGVFELISKIIRRSQLRLHAGLPQPFYPAFFFIASLAKKLNVRWFKLKNTLKNASMKHHDANALGSIASGICVML